MHIEAGRFHGRSLPAAHGARPVGGRLRGSVFSVLAPWIPNARVLDLFAGIGAFGLEALSRGAAEVVLVEQNARAARALVDWAEAAHARDAVQVLVQDARRGALPDGPFDLVFVDPPFALWKGPGVRSLLARAAGRLAAEGLVVLKVPARFEPPEDPAYETVRRRQVGTVAWILLARRTSATDAP